MKIGCGSTVFRIGILAALLCVYPFVALAGQTGPKAMVETHDYDFGSVMEGEDVRHDFVIKNIGDAPLNIRGTRTG